MRGTNRKTLCKAWANPAGFQSVGPAAFLREQMIDCQNPVA
jgi:hypothetical protein